MKPPTVQNEEHRAIARAVLNLDREFYALTVRRLLSLRKVELLELLSDNDKIAGRIPKGEQSDHHR